MLAKHFLILVLALSSIVSTAGQRRVFKSKTKFPRILWCYWHGTIEDATLITRLGLNNMKYYTQQAGWELKIVTSGDYTKYLSPETNAVF
jgi:hypothetical protein